MRAPHTDAEADRPGLDLEFVCAAVELRSTGFELSLARCLGDDVLDRFEVALPALSASALSGPIEPPPWLNGALLVVSDPAVGACVGERLAAKPRSILDNGELISLLLGGAPSVDAPSQAQALDLQLELIAESAIELCRRIFLRLIDLLMEMDLGTIQQAAQLSAGLEWPFRALLLEVERAMLGSPDEGRGQRAFAALLDPPPAPLPASGRQRPISSGDARSALSMGGRIARGFDQFETRTSQLAMLDAVVEALNGGGHALIEAGTGTGKSFAYLVPAVMFAAANERRVVVSTNTINLQDQLFEKDLPRVVSALGAPIRTTVVKGRNNYLCLRRWTQLLHSETLTAGEQSLLLKTLFWVPRTRTGDRAELRLTSDEEQAWGRVCALAEACTPTRCQYHRAGLCFLARARKHAEASHLVVINHALLLTDLLTESRVLPDYDHLIVDEAHHLEDEATAQLGWSVGSREIARHLSELVDSISGPGRLRDAFAVLRRAGGGGAPTSYGEGEQIVHRCRAAADGFAATLASFLAEHGQSIDGGQVVLRITSASRVQPAWAEVEIAWDGLVRQLYGLAQHLARLVGALEVHAGEREEANELASVLATEGLFWETVRQQLQRSIGGDEHDAIVWLTRTRGDEVTIHLAPLEVGEALARRLFDNKECVILTSATLTAAGRFDFVRTRLGLEDVRELRVASPFDYARSAIVLAPADMPEPTHPSYQRGVEWVVGQIVTAIGGRTLVLHTSYSQLRSTSEELRSDLERAGITVLAQGVDGSSRGQLLETFRHRQPAVLFGTSSFWEGVDVVGDALSCVIMPRLPFSVPTDPVFQARSELFEDPFRQYSVPQAILRFRQGFGRLIRSQQDRGAFIVLDRRILSKYYGAMFLRSLPEASLDTGPIRSLPERAAAWLSNAPAR